MAKKVVKSLNGLNGWSVSELGSFYVDQRTALVAHARRTLGDSARAEEVVQEALIKLMLAAPDLESKEHARAYLNRSIDNLCIDIFRMEGRRPNLVVLESNTTEIETAWVNVKDHADVVAEAEDAAIVRQALAMLSPAERTALVMWELEDREAKEIALELGIKLSAVRHTISRARTSLRRVLTELVIDESRGLTALDLLSKSYKKSFEIAKKSSKAAFSLILLLFAFLGFNSIQVDSDLSKLSSDESQMVKSSVNVVPTTQASSNISEKKSQVQNPSNSGKEKSQAANLRNSDVVFPGLDENGLPTGFTVADSSGGFGEAYFTERASVATDTELVSGQIIKTLSGAANIFISQSLIIDGSGLSYRPAISFGQIGTWIPLNVSLASLNLARQSSGNYLLTAYIAVESPIQTQIKVGASSDGRDLSVAPLQVVTRLVLDPSKTKVLAQAVYVVEQDT